jgi:peptide/nickel transport system permease protein
VLRYTATRLAYAMPLLFGVVVVIFCVLQLVPGDPVQAIVGEFPVPPAFRAAIEARYHLSDPLWLRLYHYFATLLHGDLGFSFRLQQSVLSAIMERAPRTLLLAITGYAVGILAGILVGIHAAITNHRTVDQAWTCAVLVGYAMPSFWVGQLLVIVFAMHLGWLPTQGMGPLISRASGVAWFAERVPYLILPVTTYAIYEGTRVARLIKASVTDTLNQGYIVTARQKGLTRSEIIRGHVIRNSILPVVTAMGYSFGTAMGGAVLIETVFSWPGVGLLMIDAIRMRDNQVIVGVVLFVAVCVILMNLIVDLLYFWLDPRIRVGR